MIILTNFEPTLDDTYEFEAFVGPEIILTLFLYFGA